MASDEVVYAFSKSRAGETPHQPPSWPQSQSNRKRGSTSPTLPDEELTSMLQSYLDDTAKKYSSNSKASSEAGSSPKEPASNEPSSQEANLRSQGLREAVH